MNYQSPSVIPIDAVFGYRAPTVPGVYRIDGYGFDKFDCSNILCDPNGAKYKLKIPTRCPTILNQSDLISLQQKCSPVWAGMCSAYIKVDPSLKRDGEQCGGLVGAMCMDGLYCNYDTNQFKPDRTGICDTLVTK